MGSNINHAVAKAIELFDQQKYREAFAAFVEIYGQSQEKDERNEIFEILYTAFYAPNVDELRGNYEKNLQVLKGYPYFWDKVFHKFDDLAFQLFPISDEIFYCYDKEKDCFYGEYDAKTRHQIRYFFKNLDEPLFVEDEDNFYNLNFLNDNVRASEDYAGDNHIYLFYTSMEPLERLMLSCDLEPVLRQEKFVFLIGGKNRKRYPIHFKKRFAVDYSKIKPTPVRIEELKRICFWYKHAYSGTELSIQVLGSIDEIQMCSGYSFDTYSTVDGNPLYFSPSFREITSNPNCTYTVDQISDLLNTGRYHIQLDELDDYLAWLRKQRPKPHIYSVKELFGGYFLFQYEKKGLNPRIVPTLLFDPHMWDTSVYNNIVASFPYHTVLTSMREPIVTFGRAYIYGLIGWDQFQTQYILSSDYTHARFLSPELLDHYYGFRFEDLKSKPEIVCRALCRHLNVPYTPKMLETEAPAADRSGNVIKGFDQTPLHRDVSSVLTEFDQLRLKIFYDPILRYYGYPYFSFEEYPLTEKMVRDLFQYPFRFERLNKEYLKSAPPEAVLHEWIQSILQEMWLKQATFPKLIPLEDEMV